MECNRASGYIPIIIGITGHRDIREEDIPILETKVRGIMADIRGQCSNSKIIVISSLAEGADRLCSRIALELGMEIHVLLPMKQCEYEKDFISDESIGEFRELLSQASCIIDFSEGKDFDTGNKDRSDYYVRSSIYVAKYCHILLALWDGADCSKPGGTSYTVNIKRRPEQYASLRAHTSLFKPEDGGTVYHIMTPRVSNPIPSGEPFSLRILPQTEENKNNNAHKKAVNIINAIDRFNQDVKKLAPSLNKGMSQSRDFLCNEQKYGRLPLPLSKMADAFTAADCLSVYFRNKRLTALKLLSIMGLLLVLLFLFYDELESNTMLLIYGAVLIAIFAYYFYTKKKDNIITNMSITAFLQKDSAYNSIGSWLAWRKRLMNTTFGAINARFNG